MSRIFEFQKSRISITRSPCTFNLSKFRQADAEKPKNRVSIVIHKTI